MFQYIFRSIDSLTPKEVQGRNYGPSGVHIEWSVGVNDSKETRVVKPMSTEEQIIDINNLFGGVSLIEQK